MATRFPPPIEPMLLTDISAVMRIERKVFPTPWSPRAYRYDLSMDRYSHYWVLRGWDQGMPPLLAYAGFWLWDTQAHIGTIAVHPQWQRRGLGEWLLVGVLTQAARLGADEVTLEVRVSNHAARALYRKLGLRRMGRRRRYYTDTGEDGLIMTLEGLQTSRVRRRIREQRAAARQRLYAEFADQEQVIMASDDGEAGARISQI